MDELKKTELIGLLINVKRRQFNERQLAALEPRLEAFLKIDPADVTFSEKEFRKAYRELRQLWPKRI